MWLGSLKIWLLAAHLKLSVYFILKVGNLTLKVLKCDNTAVHVMAINIFCRINFAWNSGRPEAPAAPWRSVLYDGDAVRMWPPSVRLSPSKPGKEQRNNEMRVPCVQLAPQQPPRSIWKQFIRRRGRHFSLFAAPSFVCRWGRPETARSTRKKKFRPKTLLLEEIFFVRTPYKMQSSRQFNNDRPKSTNKKSIDQPISVGDELVWNRLNCRPVMNRLGPTLPLISRGMNIFMSLFYGSACKLKSRWLDLHIHLHRKFLHSNLALSLWFFFLF